MRTIIGIGLVLTTLAFSSCKETETLPVQSPNYMPLAVGNYWIYHWYFEDPNASGSGIFNRGNTGDSTIVEKDTMINGKTYYKVVQYLINLTTDAVINTNVSFWRYSNTELMDHEGAIVMSGDPALGIFRTDTTVNNLPHIYMSFDVSATSNIVTKTVNAGTFHCLENKGIATYIDNGVTKPKPNIYTYYAENIGRIQTNAYLLSNERQIEMRLERYHLN